MAATIPSQIYRCEVAPKCCPSELGACAHTVTLIRKDGAKVIVPLMNGAEIAAILYVLSPVKIENPSGPYHFDFRLLRDKGIHVDVDVVELLTKIFERITFQPLKCLSEAEFRAQFSDPKIRKTTHQIRSVLYTERNSKIGF